jgi:hypothetical protein
MRPTIPREISSLSFLSPLLGDMFYVIKIPLLCPTLRAEFCGLRIFGCRLVTDWAARFFFFFGFFGLAIDY